MGNKVLILKCINVFVGIVAYAMFTHRVDYAVAFGSTVLSDDRRNPPVMAYSAIHFSLLTCVLTCIYVVIQTIIGILGKAKILDIIYHVLATILIIIISILLLVDSLSMEKPFSDYKKGRGDIILTLSSFCSVGFGILLAVTAFFVWKS